MDTKVTLDEMTGEPYGRLQPLSLVQPSIVRHVAELKRMTKFVTEAPEEKSPLPPLSEIWENLRTKHVPLPMPRRPPPRISIDPVAAQLRRDLAYAKQLAKAEYAVLMSDEPVACPGLTPGIELRCKLLTR